MVPIVSCNLRFFIVRRETEALLIVDDTNGIIPRGNIFGFYFQVSH